MGIFSWIGRLFRTALVGTDPPPLPVQGAVLEFEYEDAHGEKTRRRVVLSHHEVDGDRTYLHGHCQLRDEERSFRVDRINFIVDEHGEVHDIPATYLCQVLRIEMPTPYGDRDWLMERCKRGLRALMLVATATGPLDDAKRRVLFAYVLARADMLAVTATDDSILRIAEMLPRMRPSPRVALAALQKQVAFDRRWEVHHRLIRHHAMQLADLGPRTEAVQAALALIEDAATLAPPLRDERGREVV